MKRILVLAALAAACAQPPKKDYSKLISSNPRAILVVPVVNKSVDVGMADASLVHGSDPTRLCTLFGADAVLYVTIEQWAARYMILSTQVTVEFDYVLKDGRTGEELWKDHQTGVYASQSGGQGLAGAIAAAIVAKAAPNYMPMAREANARALAYPGPGFPAGPYRPEYRKDLPPPAAPESPAAAKPAAPRAPGAPQAPAAPQ